MNEEECDGNNVTTYRYWTKKKKKSV